MNITRIFVCMLVCIIVSPRTFPQTVEGTERSEMQQEVSLLAPGESVPSTTSITGSIAFSPFGVVPNYGTWDLTVGFRGKASLGYSREVTFGLPLGDILPMDRWKAVVQLSAPQDGFPALTISYEGMIRRYGTFYSIADLYDHDARLVSYGLNYLAFNASLRRIGLGMTSIVSDHLTITGMLGINVLDWQQSRTYYFWPPALQTPLDTAPLPKEHTVDIHAAIAVYYEFVKDVVVDGSVQSLPLLEIEPTTFRLGVKNGILLGAGIHYQVLNGIRVDISDRFITGYTHMKSQHHVRLGVSAAVDLSSQQSR